MGLPACQFCLGRHPARLTQLTARSLLLTQGRLYVLCCSLPWDTRHAWPACLLCAQTFYRTSATPAERCFGTMTCRHACPLLRNGGRLYVVGIEPRNAADPPDAAESCCVYVCVCVSYVCVRVFRMYVCVCVCVCMLACAYACLRVRMFGCYMPRVALVCSSDRNHNHNHNHTHNRNHNRNHELESNPFPSVAFLLPASHAFPSQDHREFAKHSCDSAYKTVGTRSLSHLPPSRSPF